MPIATVKTPDGKTMRLQVPEGATQEEIVAFAQKQYQQSATPPPQQEPPQAAPTGDRGSIANSLGSGLTFGFADEILALPMAAVAKMAGDAPEGATFGDVYKGMRDTIRGDNKAFAERNPGTALAGEVAGGLLTGGTGIAKAGGSLLKSGGAGLWKRLAVNAVVGGAEGAIAGAGYSEGETAGEVATDAAAGAGIGGFTGAVGGEVVNAFQRNSALKRKIGDMLASGNTDRKVAKYMLDGAGKVKKDPAAKTAISQGFDEGTIAAVKGSSPADKAKMKQMVSLMKRTKDNALEGMRNRPSDVVGDSLMKRVNFIKSVNRQAGSKLDDVAKSLKGKQVEYEAPVNQFISDLMDMDITFDPKTMKPNFKGSSLEGLKGPQQAINRIMLRMKDTQTPDAYDLHRLKKYIDESVNFDKTSGSGFSAKVEGVLKKLRHNLDNTLDTKFPEYNQVNTQYAETRNALDMLQKGVGPSVNLSSPTADKAAGKSLRKVMSNYASRENLIDGMDEIEKVTKKYASQGNNLIGKAPKFDDDLMMQALFANELDRVFGSSARTSFQGSIEGAANSMANASIDAATGNKVGLARSVINAATSKKQDPDKAFEAISRLLD